MEGILCRGLLRHTLANGLLSTQATVEGIMLKAAWHWGSDSNVVSDPLGEPGRIPLYVGFLSMWHSMVGDHMFSPYFVGELLNWELLRDINEFTQPLAVETEDLSP